ncbi:MAG: Cytochrome c-type biogenesis protein CcmE, heme chaperone [Ktedonobacterales bacterium]|jgi:cytochrome c-type biogenesis protein CcmE|nr:MAG: Cytochrome c-type biogenesis protein CcmE, heme chaperone [Ktedonobacterales bacterium]
MQIEQIAQPSSIPTPTRARRRKLPWGFLIAGIAIAGAVLYLVFANTSASAEYYMTIKELRACTTCSARDVRVAGTVVPNSVVKSDQTQIIHFSISDAGGALPVVYSGTVPDIFRAGVQVVVEGKLDSHGVFQAQTLLAKCPSKFQSATPPAYSN